MRPLALAAFLGLVAVADAADPLPDLDYADLKLFGSTRREEVMLNRTTAFTGGHLGGVHVDRSRTPNRFYVFDAANNRVLGFRRFRPAEGPDGPFSDADIVIGQPSPWDAAAANGDNLRLAPPTDRTLAFLPFPYVSSTMEAPRAGTMATDADGDFYCVDLCNNRVLRFDDPFATDTVADAVWGQPGFTTRDRGVGPDRLRTDWNYGTTIGVFAAGVDVDADGNLWVADSGNHRVLRFPGGAKTADLVLGQDSFYATATGTALNRMYKPTAVRLHPDTGELYVLDGQMDGGHRSRLLVFTPPFTSGMAAAREIGGGGDPDPNAGLKWARGFAFDPVSTERVWIADGDNHRIAAFNTATGALLEQVGPTYRRPDGRTWHLRQPDGDIGFDDNGRLHFCCPYGQTPVVRIPVPITTDPSGAAIADAEMLRAGMNQVSGRTFNDFYGSSRWGTYLHVSDRNRLLVWTNYPGAVTFQQADLVVGQEDLDHNEPGGTFESRAVNLHSVDGDVLWVATTWKAFAFPLPIESGGRNVAPLRAIDGGAADVRWEDDGSPVRFQFNGGLLYDADAGCLWVGDRDNHRVLRIRDPLSADPRVDLVLGQRDRDDGEPNHGDGLYAPDAHGFAAVWSLHRDRFGNLYVVDSGYEGRIDSGGNLRVVRFDAADLAPVPGTIFPFPAATGVFAKPDLVTNRDWSESNRPHTPISLAFADDDRMVMLCDSYGNPQGQLLFVYPTPHTGPAPQPTHVIPTLFGQPATARFDGSLLVAQDHTWNRVHFLVPAETAPAVDIITGPTVVVGVDAIRIEGTANDRVAGPLRWQNGHGAHGEIPAAPTWAVEAVPLVEGANIITVSGAAADGALASDTVTITSRPASGHGAPEIGFTTDPADVPETAAEILLRGWCNDHCVGDVTWKNSRGGSGAVPARLNWKIAGVSLAVGTNVVKVIGTNLEGAQASASLSIVRAEGDGTGTLSISRRPDQCCRAARRQG